MLTFGRGRSKDKQKMRVKRNKRSGCGQQQQDTRRGSPATVAVLDVLCIYSHAICVQRACAGLSPLEALSFYDAAARFAVSQLSPITLGPTCLSLSFTT